MKTQDAFTGTSPLTSLNIYINSDKSQAASSMFSYVQKGPHLSSSAFRASGASCRNKKKKSIRSEQRTRKVLLHCLCNSNSQLAIVEHGVVDAHEDVSKDPAQKMQHVIQTVPRFYAYNALQHSTVNDKHHRKLVSHDCSSKYQRGPRGGGTSKAVNPLMHWAAAPSPTLRTYCSPEFKRANG